MRLDNEQQRVILTDVLDHFARTTTQDASREAVQKLVVLHNLRTAVMAATVEPSPVRESGPDDDHTPGKGTEL